MENKNQYFGAKYFSDNDLSIATNLDSAEAFLNSHGIDTISDINEILEIYNIYKLLQSGVILKTWSSEKIRELREQCYRIPSIINSHTKTISDNNIVELFNKTSILYREDFFELLDKYNTFQHISKIAFEKLLDTEGVMPYYYLKRKKLVNYYGEEIANYIRYNPLRFAEIVLSSHLTENKDPRNILFLPETLSPDDKKKIIDQYIESDDANPNYLNLIASSIDGKCIMLDPETRLKAKRKYQLWIEKNIPSGSGMKIGAEVVFAYIDEDVRIEDSGEIPRYIYNKHWIEDNRDYPTLMQNFITLFEFADFQSRLLPIAYDSEIGVLEKHLGVKGKKDYPYGVSFMFKSCLSSLQMAAYQVELHNKGIQIEEVYSWFFSQYLDEEFGIKGFSFRAPTENSTFREKTRDLLAELDGVIKQYDLFVRHQEIDRELLEITSSSPAFENLKSLCKEKYGYVESKELSAVLNMLFSDQSILGYNMVTKDKYNNFAEAVLKERIHSYEFETYQLEQIKWLIEKEVIVEDENKVIRMNLLRFPIYAELYYREVLCLQYVSESLYVRELIDSGHIIVENTLFSRPEQNYLDYMLNHHKYNNGKDIRNRYAHGSNTLSEEQQRTDYYDVLKIIAMIIIKINQEFCLRDNMVDRK